MLIFLSCAMDIQIVSLDLIEIDGRLGTDSCFGGIGDVARTCGRLRI